MESAIVDQSHSDLLRAKIRLAAPRLDEQLSLFWNHSQFEAVFLQHLIKLYYCVNSSVPLLTSARQRSQELAQSCSVAAALAPYFREHIIEEHDHDVWLLEDIEVLGVSRADVTSRIPPSDVATLIGCQHYYIQHGHPLAMMAYLAVVEGNPPTVEGLDQLLVNTTIPKAALRSFYKHAEIDIGHSEEIWNLIDSLPLQPWHISLLGISAMLATEHIACLMENLLSSFDNE